MQSSSALAVMGYSFGSETSVSSKVLYGFGVVVTGLEKMLSELWKKCPSLEKSYPLATLNAAKRVMLV